MDRRPAQSDFDVGRFDRWASSYEQSICQRWYFQPVHSRMLDLLESAGPDIPPGRVLDIGCGTGRLLRSVLARWPSALTVGVDPAPRMIAEARRLNPNGVFQVAYAEALPFSDETADLVLSSLSFHHWADQEKGLREIARVLRTGGYLCLADHTMVLARLWGEKPRNREQLRFLMRGAGLTVRQQQGLGLRSVLITLAQK